MVIYVCMVSCFVVMGGTGMYLFFQCSPVQYVFSTVALSRNEPGANVKTGKTGSSGWKANVTSAASRRYCRMPWL
jgi:hypothetical protein